MTEKTLTGSLEDYLEAIYQLIKKENAARVKDLAQFLDVRKSSVTAALRVLASKGLIRYSPYSEIVLTHKGSQTAQDVIRRHETLKDFFTEVLGVKSAMADATACKMEHVLPPEVTERLLRFMEFVELHPGNGRKWLEEFHAFYRRQAAGDVPSGAREIQPGRAGAPRPGAAGHAGVILLSELPTGVKAEIAAIHHTGMFRKRILEMGVTVGAVLMIERVAPLGDPIDIKIRGYHLSLRKEEARRITVIALE